MIGVVSLNYGYHYRREWRLSFDISTCSSCLLVETRYWCQITDLTSIRCYSNTTLFVQADRQIRAWSRFYYIKAAYSLSTGVTPLVTRLVLNHLLYYRWDCYMLTLTQRIFIYSCMRVSAKHLGSTDAGNYVCGAR